MREIPAAGVWCDAEAFTDPDLLVDLAELDPNIALGVLMNPHLTGDKLARASARATFSVKGCEQLPAAGAPILRGRSVEDQQTILLAAVRRSPATARELMRFASPATIAALRTRIDQGPLRGAEALTTAIDLAITDPMRAQLLLHQESADALIAELADPTNVGDTATQALSLRGDRDALVALGERLDGGGTQHPYLDDMLLLATEGHPEVVREWATSSARGRNLLASDHRQPAEVLAELLFSLSEDLLGNDNIASEAGITLRNLVRNIAAPRQAFAEFMAEMLTLATGPRTSTVTAEVATAAAGVVAIHAVSLQNTWTVAEMIAAAKADPSTAALLGLAVRSDTNQWPWLLRLELIEAASVHGPAFQGRLAGQMLAHDYWGTTPAAVTATMDQLVPGAAEHMSVSLRDEAECRWFYTGAAAVNSHQAGQQRSLLDDADAAAHHDGLQHALAPLLASLRSATAIRDVYRRVLGEPGNVDLEQLVTDQLAAAQSVHASHQGHHDLLGSGALGTI